MGQGADQFSIGFPSPVLFRDVYKRQTVTVGTPGQCKAWAVSQNNITSEWNCAATAKVSSTTGQPSASIKIRILVNSSYVFF